MKRLLKWFAALVLVLVAGVAGWLAVSPPALVLVATNYAAKMVCSNVFVAKRDAGEVMAVDVQAPGHPIFKAITVNVDGDVVTAKLLGLFGAGRAVNRGNGLGCSSIPGGDMALMASAIPESGIAAPDEHALWPAGEAAEPSQDPALEAILNDGALTGPNLRGLVVIHNGRIAGERYGDRFSAITPLLGWSMTKTVTAAIIGTLIKDSKLSIEQTGLFESWKNDERKDITLGSMMAMSSGLAWNEGYGDVSDVTRMLYLETDMAGFVASKPYDPVKGNPEDDRLFNYSSGTTVALSDIWMRAIGKDAAANYPRKALFGPLGMASAVLEADASGTFVGSSYLYATARDWARFGQLLLQRGAWNGQSILPSGYVDWMVAPAPASMAKWGKHEYGHQVWLHGPSAGTPEGEDPDKGFDLPGDAFWMLGHDGQSICVIPSLDLVVVRMGLTPSKLGYKPQGLVSALAKHFKG